MKKLINKIITVSRVLIVIFAVMALTLNGVGAAQRLFTNYDNITDKTAVDGDIAWL